MFHVFFKREQGKLTLVMYEGAQFASVEGMARHNLDAAGFKLGWEGDARSEHDALANTMLNMSAIERNTAFAVPEDKDARYTRD